MATLSKRGNIQFTLNGRPEWWTVRELAERWRKSPEVIVRMIGAGALRAMKIGGSWRIHQDAITAYERPAKPAASKPVRKAPACEGRDLVGALRAARDKR